MMAEKHESLKKAKVLLSHIKARQGQLSLLERLHLSEEERGSLEQMKKELQELEEEAEFYIKILSEE